MRRTMLDVFALSQGNKQETGIFVNLWDLNPLELWFGKGIIHKQRLLWEGGRGAA